MTDLPAPRQRFTRVDGLLNETHVITASARISLANGDLDQAARHAADAVRIVTDTDSARNLTAACAAQSAITARRQGR
ncbi:hypothetical protein GTY83_00960 [Streptomyces sp. SID4928]|uniref:hypothetical protein n=1 Tax=unclassified Streptomyces TaxID=2593676 RepID=UPI0001C1A142|nr:hypothetical protein [Streptomyces sp. ACT-1]EGE39602.1 hypothetical protein SACT1_0193 [Streptomyces sp. ACT-1]MYR47693.1 hypothetical protein [Streptomyces sp. SID4928]